MGYSGALICFIELLGQSFVIFYCQLVLYDGGYIAPRHNNTQGHFPLCISVVTLIILIPQAELYCALLVIIPMLQ